MKELRNEIIKMEKAIEIMVKEMEEYQNKFYKKMEQIDMMTVEYQEGKNHCDIEEIKQTGENYLEVFSFVLHARNVLGDLNKDLTKLKSRIS